MMKNIHLIFGIHCHQPEGNFDWIFKRSADTCYLPFLRAVDERPFFKCVIHYSGCLLRYFKEELPEGIDLIGSLVERGQAELVGGGHYEPILAVLPEEERIGQVTRMSDDVEKLFGVRPRGAWLTERVWEPQLAKTLSASGIEYLFLDDQHFQSAGCPPDDICDDYVTEESGGRVRVFPISEKLRYLIPFGEPDAIIGYLKYRAERSPGHLLTYVDDGEKFGIWPGTHQWVYEKQWLTRFFNALESSPDVTMVLPSEWQASHAPRGLLYFPTASYMEMSEWTLSGKLQTEFEALVNEIKAHPHGETRRLLLRAGFWRQFFVKYPESNWMHKRWVHALTRMAPAMSRSREIRELMDRAACNDAYWHGVFGGLYLPHLRNGVWRNLAEAESLYDKKQREKVTVDCEDISSDGRPDILVRTPDWVVSVDPGCGGAFRELTHRGLLYNFQNTLTRRYEGYHDKIRADAGGGHGGGIKSIHDGMRSKEAGLDRYLVYDRYPKLSGLTGTRARPVTLDDVRRQDLPVDLDAPWDHAVKKSAAGVEITLTRGGLEKTVVIPKTGSRLSVRVSTGKLDVESCLAYVWELFYASPADVTLHPGGSGSQPFDPTAGAEFVTSAFSIRDGVTRSEAHFSFGRAVTIALLGSYTVSQSEEGYEKTFQGLTVWVSTEPSRRPSLEMNLEVTAHA